MIKHQKAFMVAVGLMFLISGVIGGVYVGRSRGIPFVARQSKWSIGMYLGESPFSFVSPENVSNPVLTAGDVTDVPADFVADPFIVEDNSTWYMFFEVMNARSRQGDIGLATSDDGLNWIYRQIVLDKSFHLSYPYVFKWRDEYYMIPESHQTNSIQLYRAAKFPEQWSFVGVLLDGYYVDSSIFRYDGRWWIFAQTNPRRNDTLRLYYANELTGAWIEHPSSPIIEGDANIARPGGRVLVFDDRIIRYVQDDDPTYGNKLRAFEITQLTVSNYEEREVCEISISGVNKTDFKAEGIHHIDLHRIEKNKWIACIDSYDKSALVFGFGY